MLFYHVINFRLFPNVRSIFSHCFKNDSYLKISSRLSRDIKICSRGDLDRIFGFPSRNKRDHVVMSRVIRKKNIWLSRGTWTTFECGTDPIQLRTRQIGGQWLDSLVWTWSHRVEHHWTLKEVKNVNTLLVTDDTQLDILTP